MNRRSLLAAAGTVGAASLAGGLGGVVAAGSAAAATTGPAPATAPPTIRPPRPVAPVNQEVAAAHSEAYRTLPDVVVGVDVEQLMAIHTEQDAQATRTRLIRHVWGSDSLPDVRPEVHRDVDAPALPPLEGVRRIDRLTVQLPYGVVSEVFHLFPHHTTHGRAAFYHNGHGEPLDTLRRTAQALLDGGYQVLLCAMPFYHWNPTTMQDPQDPSVTHEPSHNDLGLWETPEFSTLRLFLEPLVAAMNHLQASQQPPSVQMIGLSGGGWTSTVYPALDPRVTRSYPTAGSLPFFLRPGSPKPSPTTGDWEQRQDRHPGFYAHADFMDMYALGSVGTNRRQIQILNRFDECCFNGVGHRCYEAVVRHRVAVIGNGEWELLEDATHGDHTISPYALSVIMWDLDVNCADLP